MGSVFRVHCLPPLLQLQRPACCATRYVQQVCVRACVRIDDVALCSDDAVLRVMGCGRGDEWR